MKSYSTLFLIIASSNLVYRNSDFLIFLNLRFNFLVKVNIFLIRHGEKPADGKSLSNNGLKQVKLLVKRLKKIKIDKIISSGLTRCKMTSEIIADELSKKVIFDSGLREVDGEVKENSDKHTKEIRIIKSFWNKISKEKGNILLVGGGNVNKILIALALKINPRNSRFVQIPSGLIHLEYLNKNKTRIVYINDTSHLPEKIKQWQSY